MKITTLEPGPVPVTSVDELPREKTNNVVSEQA